MVQNTNHPRTDQNVPGIATPIFIIIIYLVCKVEINKGKRFEGRGWGILRS